LLIVDTMSNPPSSQSINIHNSHVSGAQIGQAERDVTQVQTDHSVAQGVANNQAEAIALLAALEAHLKQSLLPIGQRDKALSYLSAAKTEAASESPDKDFAAMSLKKLAGVLQDANESIETSQNIWANVKPLLEKLLPWLGVAAGFLV